MSACAIIPARGGSKRIPRKNVKPFHGRPMIGWSIRAAITSGCFDRIVVSTDDEEIAEVARAEGAEVPFMRPRELSDDFTPTVPVVQHGVEWLIDAGQDATEICCIYATAPFVLPGDLRAGLEKLRELDCAYVFSATSFPFPVQRAMRMREGGNIEMLQPEHVQTRSQDLEETYHDAGQFYWGTREAWLSGKAIIGPESSIVTLPRFRVQDIDTPEDWQMAEMMFDFVRNRAA